jgi:hypothetical protein
MKVFKNAGLKRLAVPPHPLKHSATTDATTVLTLKTFDLRTSYTSEAL